MRNNSFAHLVASALHGGRKLSARAAMYMRSHDGTISPGRSDPGFLKITIWQQITRTIHSVTHSISITICNGPLPYFEVHSRAFSFSVLLPHSCITLWENADNLIIYSFRSHCSTSVTTIWSDSVSVARSACIHFTVRSYQTIPMLGVYNALLFIHGISFIEFSFTI